ncbi:MAG TPA: TolC family protein [Pseudomonadales bacterium]|nr:TolC family protein [Pseudomonadales bacterium]
MPALVLALLGVAAGPALAAPLSLHEAERLAFADDPGAVALRARADAARERAVADSQLPDPVVSMAAMNFPVDTLAFDQEPMTQVRLGIRQQFPGGDTLAQRRALREAEAGRFDASTTLRRLQVLRAVRIAWLDLGGLLRERQLIEEAQPLLADLEATVLAGYRQGAGAQQDVLRARLELDGLDDRLLRNQAAVDVARAELARWIGPAAYTAEPGGARDLVAHAGERSPQEVEGMLLAHPAIAVHAARIGEEDAQIGLAEAAYSPDWGLEIAYGIRDELSPVGDRPDFLSAAVTFDLPLFQGRRQDRGLAAAQFGREAARATRLDALRELQRDWHMERARHARLDERLALFMTRVIPHAQQTAEAARRAFGTDAADFPEVMRTALATLDARIEQERMRFDLYRSAARLQFLVADDLAPEAHPS